jgi:cell wall assembly regulator SMI1
MNPLVKRLDSWLKKNRPDYYAILRPGLKSKEIKAFEKLLGFSLPQTWKDLYTWRNGQHDPNALDPNGKVDPSPWLAFRNNAVFGSLHVVQDSYTLLNGLLECGQFEEKNWWNVKWVPILTGLGGDHVCLDLEGSFRGQPGQILYFCHDDTRRVIEYPSLDSCLETFIVSLEAGMWEEQDGCFQPKDEKKWQGLHKKMNRGYPKYKHAGP